MHLTKKLLCSLALTSLSIQAAQEVDRSYRYHNRLRAEDNDRSRGTAYREKGFDDLGWAIHNFAKKEVEEILRNGRNPNHQLWSWQQRTPFITSVVARSTHPVIPPLRHAHEKNAREATNQAILDLLIKYKANVNVGASLQNSLDFNTPLLSLWEAILLHRPDIAQKLVDTGAIVSKSMIAYVKKDGGVSTLNTQMLAILEKARALQLAQKCAQCGTILKSNL